MSTYLDHNATTPIRPECFSFFTADLFRRFLAMLLLEIRCVVFRPAHRCIASLTSCSHRSANEMPARAAAFASTEWLVKPGIVFTSRQ